MSKAAAEYEKLVARLRGTPGVAAGQMFGKACLKINGKAFVAQHRDTVVFKLSGTAREEALSLPGAVLWDPSGRGHPMKEWIALPEGQSKNYGPFANAALEYASATA